MAAEIDVAEIKLANLANLQHAQALLAQSPLLGRLSLGMSEEVADFISSLKPSQLKSLANSDILLFSFRFQSQSLDQLRSYVDGDQLAMTHLHMTAAAETGALA